MRGTSQASLNVVQRRFEAVLASAGVEARDLIGEQLLDLVTVLDGSAAMTRALTDPGRSNESKAALAHSLLDGKCDPRVAQALADLAEQRWSRERDIVESVETLGINGILVGAQEAKVIEEVEDQLFRIDRMLVGNRELRTALSNSQLPVQLRIDLTYKVFGGKIRNTTMELLVHIVANPRGRTLAAGLLWLGRLAAARRSRLLASVTSAVALTPKQIERLGDILQRSYGQEMQLNVSIDPDVLGGVSVQIGDDQVDSTMLSQLESLRRRMAG